MHKSNFELQEMYEDRSERRENVFRNKMWTVKLRVTFNDFAEYDQNNSQDD